jgi:hypothetical protein
MFKNSNIKVLFCLNVGNIGLLDCFDKLLRIDGGNFNYSFP